MMMKWLRWKPVHMMHEPLLLGFISKDIYTCLVFDGTGEPMYKYIQEQQHHKHYT